MVVLFIGISGSGKDTQANLLEQRKDFVQIATGQILRDRAGRDDELGHEIAAAMQKGFVDSKLIEQILGEQLSELSEKNVVLNGTVRKIDQIEMLDTLLEKRGLKLDRVIYFDLPESEAVHRLYLRRHCAQDQSHLYHLDFFPPREAGKCDIDGSPLITRRDDQPAAIHERLIAFKHDNSQIYERYMARGILRRINAGQTVEKVFEEIVNALP